MKNLTFFALVLFAIMALLFTACFDNYIFDKSYSIKNEKWTYADSLNFEVEIKDTAHFYNLYFDITHSIDYTYQNLYVKIYTTFPFGERQHQLLSVDLANKVGQWNGKCNSKSCDLRVFLQQKAYFNVPGVYTITFEQYMRQDSLPGIQNLALRLEKTEVLN